MSYSEYTWQTGETITAEKLNNLEEGVQEALAGSEDKTLIITIETENFDPNQYNSYGSETGIKQIPLKSITLSEGTLEELLSDSSIIESYDVVVTKLITNVAAAGTPFIIKSVIFANTRYGSVPFSNEIGVDANAVFAPGGVFEDHEGYRFTSALNNGVANSVLIYTSIRRTA